ncbi:hypothetical protein MRX96_042149 [Rhipicephalus microplus]
MFPVRRGCHECGETQTELANSYPTRSYVYFSQVKAECQTLLEELQDAVVTAELDVQSDQPVGHGDFLLLRRPSSISP